MVKVKVVVSLEYDIEIEFWQKQIIEFDPMHGIYN